jgi:hypothetical protein
MDRLIIFGKDNLVLVRFDELNVRNDEFNPAGHEDVLGFDNIRGFIDMEGDEQVTGLIKVIIVFVHQDHFPLVEIEFACDLVGEHGSGGACT